MLSTPLIHLTAVNADTDAEAFVHWRRDSEYLRLFDSSAAQPWSLQKARAEINEPPNPAWYLFAIRARADERLLGLVELELDARPHGDAWLGIAMGDRADWGKGYGTAAMRLALHFAFTELNLHRVSLSVFEYNARALHVYEKLGFVIEGRMRQRLRRDGQWWAMILMGLLREAWQSGD